MKHRRKLLLITSLAMLLGGIGLVVLAVILTGGGTKEQPVRTFGPPISEPRAVLPTPIPEPTEEPTPEPTPEPEPPPPPSTAPIERLMIPSLGVDAPIVVLSVNANGTMQDPKTTQHVAWYNFSGYPGYGSNALFAGHIYLQDRPAVFQRLSQIKQDAEIEVRLEDGTAYKYIVFSKDLFTDNNAPLADIICGTAAANAAQCPTDDEIITIITCGGRIIPGTKEYDSRLIIRASKYREPAPEPGPEPAPPRPEEPPAAVSSGGS